ncbi:response regulator transcription factor [Kitasatospora sp. NPDC056327]|uniref:response regulator transcription factor n=1 Tax=Kitasatospora sp. NPDC056327 TaxID=3345785 RepID=UPI0035DBF3D8
MDYQSTRLMEPDIPHDVCGAVLSTDTTARTICVATHVLAVQSERRDAESLAKELRRHGYQATSVETGAELLKHFRKADLLLVDLDLPDIDGMELCRLIRSSCNIPIIVTAANESKLDHILSLRAGSDDYVAKPYCLTELTARIEAVMRRSRYQPPGPEKSITVGALHIDLHAREIRLGGMPVEVTRKEFDLLHLLASQPDGVVSRRQIMAHVWHDSRSKPGRTIDTHVSSLRGKLGSSHWITTVRGVGFRLGTPQQHGRLERIADSA